MFWQKELGYDPKDYPNYHPYQGTPFTRLLKQWPEIPLFIVWTFTFLFSILSILCEWLDMFVRDPLHFGKANAWLVEQYQSCDSVFQITYGAFITFWFLHLCYCGLLVALDELLHAYDDPVWACLQLLDLVDYLQTLSIRIFTGIIFGILNVITNSAIFIYDMTEHGLGSLIVLLGVVALFQLYYYLFFYDPTAEEKQPPQPLRSILKKTSENVLQSQITKSECGYGIFASPAVTPIPITPYNPPWRSNSGCFRVPTPSTGSSNSSLDRTPSRRRPSPKSNKPPGASYVSVSPKSAEKLRADGYGVPEPTREPTYSWIKPVTPAKLIHLPPEAEEEGRFIHSIAPTKAQWVYSSLDAVERRVRHITENVEELAAKVTSFSEAATIQPIPEPSGDLPASPRTQKRAATILERERIKAAKKEHAPKIEHAAMAIFQQQHGVEQLIKQIKNLINQTKDPVSGAAGRELEDYKVKVKSIFANANQELIKSRNTEDLCDEHLAKLANEAGQLKRLDKAHLLLLEINARKAEMKEMRDLGMTIKSTYKND
ncbi:uncharacterized protein FIESC28_04019 [Fusarium coffeatum]|uniref:Uncharacterized protein n=1 Tax=Fusarium coffeatum TaxID=231269 RepID=A0A366S1J8_9HYPO|nr:uncharacterized protein FIESC28_04019 [Fusarium coffeatum]RBR23164.1 hypothetical protein FIESC28_04019 [Fusarium coffeatum]